MSDADPTHTLAEDVDPEDVVDHFQDILEDHSARLWVALDGTSDLTATLSSGDVTIAGFVRTSLEPTPPGFEWPPDRIRIQDLWVADSYRGSGVANDLMARVRRQASENGCERLDLIVGIENERAVSYFERLGFETLNLGLHVPLSSVHLDGRVDERPFDQDSSLQLRRVHNEDAVIHRFVEEAWIPFWEAIETADASQRLSSDLDTEDVVEEYQDALEDPDRRTWVVLDEVANSTQGLADSEGSFVGWLGAGLAPTERFVDPPERLFIGNLYVAPQYRGEGLVDVLMKRAMQYAREEGCVEFSLGVGVGNQRARAYYDKIGFEPFEQRMSVPVDELQV